MSEQEVLMTLESLRQKEEELELLKTVRRKEVAARIKQAIEFGDISENSEYEDAKNEQAFIVRVIDSDNLSNEIISEYSIVEIQNLDSNQTMKFQIVGSVEAKPFEGKISNDSPIGAAVLGHAVGDELEVAVPAGTTHIKILSIEK